MSLRAQILDLRAGVRSEVPERIHASSTPRLLNDDGTTDRKDADEQGIGLPLAARMHRYIGHWSHWGTSRLTDLSIMEVSDWCHARHTDHSIPGATRSLCAAALHALSRGVEPEQLGAQPGLASLYAMHPDRRDSMLGQALEHARHWREGQERRSKGARFDGPEPLPYEPLRRVRVASS